MACYSGCYGGIAVSRFTASYCIGARVTVSVSVVYMTIVGLCVGSMYRRKEKVEGIAVWKETDGVVRTATDPSHSQT